MAIFAVAAILTVLAIFAVAAVTTIASIAAVLAILTVTTVTAIATVAAILAILAVLTVYAILAVLTVLAVFARNNRSIGSGRFGGFLRGRLFSGSFFCGGRLFGGRFFCGGLLGGGLFCGLGRGGLLRGSILRSRSLGSGLLRRRLLGRVLLGRLVLGLLAVEHIGAQLAGWGVHGSEIGGCGGDVIQGVFDALLLVLAQLQVASNAGTRNQASDGNGCIEELEDDSGALAKGAVGELEQAGDGLLSAIRVVHINVGIGVIDTADGHALGAGEIPGHGFVLLAFLDQLGNTVPGLAGNLVNEIGRNQVTDNRDDFPDGLEDLFATIVEGLSQGELEVKHVAFLVRGISYLTDELVLLLILDHLDIDVAVGGLGLCKFLEGGRLCRLLRSRSLGGLFRAVYGVRGDGVGGVFFRVEFFHRLIAGVVFLQQVAVLIEFDAVEANGIVGGLFLNEGGVVGGDGARNDGNRREGGYGHCAAIRREVRRAPMV